MQLKQQVKVFGKVVSLWFRIMPERTTLMYGFGNRCKDGRYVLFLDYDDTPLEWIKEEIRLLQEATLLLGNAYLFKTKNGYHVVFLEKLFLGQIKDFMDMTSCDKSHREIPMLYGRKVWVLRQSPKKEEKITYLGVERRFCVLERSAPHAAYLQQFMSVPMDDIGELNGKFDTEENVLMAYYRIPERNT